MNDPATVFLVDDQASVLKAMSRLMRLAGFKTAVFGSAAEFLDSDNADALGCLVLDLSMPGMSGMELHQELARRSSRLPVIFLTGDGDIGTSVQAMKLGAVDFLTKPVKSATLLAAVREAIEKSRRINAHNTATEKIHLCLARLTARERDVLGLVLSGKLNKQAAAALGTVEQTIKVHRARVMKKMEVTSVAELVRLMERTNSRIE